MQVREAILVFETGKTSPEDHYKAPAKMTMSHNSYNKTDSFV